MKSTVQSSAGAYSFSFFLQYENIAQEFVRCYPFPLSVYPLRRLKSNLLIRMEMDELNGQLEVDVALGTYMCRHVISAKMRSPVTPSRF
jgi:hypothetical protein